MPPPRYRASARLLALPPRGERDSGRDGVRRNPASNVQTNRQWEAVASGATRFNYPLACTARRASLEPQD